MTLSYQRAITFISIFLSAQYKAPYHLIENLNYLFHSLPTNSHFHCKHTEGRQRKNVQISVFLFAQGEQVYSYKYKN